MKISTAWDARIDASIEQHRKSDAMIRVTDDEDRPLAGVGVTAEQYDSPFHFGANIFSLDGFATPALNRAYEDAFCRLFNGATVPFYWRTLEPQPGHLRWSAHAVPIARRPPPDRVVAFGESRGLRLHGHPLVWNFRKWSVPDWLPADPAQAEPLWAERIRQIAGRYGDRIARWDVLNEAAAGYTYPRVARMSENYERKAFAWAAAHFPEQARLDINEVTGCWFEPEHAYAGLIRRLLDDGARIGGVGLQFHLFTDEEMGQLADGQLIDADQVWAVLNRYAAFERPIHISEITLTAPANSAAGQAAQAAAARTLYRLWFSHPSVEGVTWWNVADGGAAPGEDQVYSGLLKGNLEPKSAYQALHQLIQEEWRTQAAGQTNEQGEFHFRGFHGTYRVRLDDGIESAISLQPGTTGELHVRRF